MPSFDRSVLSRCVSCDRHPQRQHRDEDQGNKDIEVVEGLHRSLGRDYTIERSDGSHPCTLGIEAARDETLAQRFEGLCSHRFERADLVRKPHAVHVGSTIEGGSKDRHAETPAELTKAIMTAVEILEGRLARLDFHGVQPNNVCE